MGENHFTSLPVALYGVILLMAAIAYFILTLALKSLHTQDSKFVRALGKDIKGKISVIFYLVAIPLAFLQPLISASIYFFVAMMWLVPDKRFERMIG